MSDDSYIKADRLRKRTDFIHVSQQGNKVQNRHFLAYYCPSKENTSRLGITVTKRVGNAVMRNRIKRIVREHFRLSRNKSQPHLDINVIAKKESVGLSSDKLFHALHDLFEKISRDCCH